MLKKRKFYTLSDIRKQIVLTPLIFVLLASIVSIVVIYFILGFQKNNSINLYLQEDKFNKQTILNEYVNDIKYNASASFDNEETSLYEAVLSFYGYVDLNDEKLDTTKLKKRITLLEKKYNSEFVLFTDEFEILYGDKIIDYLKVITDSRLETQYFRHHMIKNISYIGTDNLIYWMDSDKKQIRMSFFKELSKQNLFFGAFSKIDDMEDLTRSAILNSIVQKSKYYKDSYFWFYDYNQGYVYNYYNKGQKIDAKFILEQDRLNSSNEILKKYQNQNVQSSVSSTYNFSKYNFLVSIKSYSFPEKLSKVKHEYNSQLSIAISIVFLIAIFLIVASILFSKFITKIFHRYNKRLETRNIMYKKWKERYELAIIASNDGLWDIDLKTNHIYFSRKWLDMLGYKDGDINNLEEWFDLIHYEDRQNVKNSFEEHVAGKSDNFVCEYRIKNKENKYKWILVRGKAFDDNHHKRMLMMSMDIEQRKKLIKELKYVDLLVEYGRIVIFKWRNDEDLTVDYLSKSINSYGYQASEFQKKEINYFDFVYEEDIQVLQDGISTAIKNDEKSFTLTYRVKDKNGDIRWIFNRTIFLKDDFGNIAHLYGYISDITEMKLTEEQLKLKVDEEVTKNTEKDRLLVHQSKLAAMGEMLGNIAHQWRQPLNNINLLTHFIRDSYGSLSKEELNSAIKDTKLQIDYMSQTIDDFRNFYQPNKDKLEFDVKDSIIQCSKIVQTQFEKNGIALSIEGAEIRTINYMNELQQVVLNILNNASDAAAIKREQTNFEAKVDVKVYVDYVDKIKIVLENNCGQVPNDVMDRMFEPYFTTKFENQGTGIGLFMAKTIIEKNMNGKIFVVNIKDGVRFTILLPL